MIQDGQSSERVHTGAADTRQPAPREAVPRLDGYVADSPYPSTFHPAFAPAWLDAILAWKQIRPPRTPRGPFTLADLGCGDGAGLILLAAAHPEGRFLGVDGMEAHVARGRDLAAGIGLDNVEFHCRPFAEADDMPAGEADYVVSQGVLAWVSPANQAALLDLAARMLRPKGVFCVGYNTLPGWGPILGFQRLVLALAEGHRGNSRERFEASVEQIRAGGMVAQEVLDWLQTDKLPPNYFAQEYLNLYWTPMWSGDVIAAAAERDLVFAALAAPGRLRPEFTFRKAKREALAAIADPAAREIASDLYANSFFRSDIYTKGPPARMAAGEARAHRLDQVWASLHGNTDVTYEARTAAGRISFDNAAARFILARLEEGPARLAEISDIGPADLLNTIDALQIAGLVVPLNPAAALPHAAAANRRIAGTLSGSAKNARVGANGVVVLPHGSDPASPDVARRLALVPGDGLDPAGGAK